MTTSLTSGTTDQLPSERSTGSVHTRAPRHTAADRQQALLDHASDGLVLLDAKANVVAVSGSYTRLLGRSPAERFVLPSIDLIHPDDRAHWQTAYSAMVSRGSTRTTIVVRVCDARRRWRWMEVTLANRLNDPAVGGIVATIHPVSGIGHGPLSKDQLGRPRGRSSRMAAAVRASGVLARATSAEVLMLLVKFDQLHLVKRTCGQLRATELAAAATEHVKRCLRPGDGLVQVDRDRLAVICPIYNTRHMAATLARRIIAALANPFHIAGQDMILTASIGIAAGRATEQNVEGLLDDADIALATAVTGGGNRWSLYLPSDRVNALEELTFPAAMLRALDEHQFVLHYQPVVDLATGAIVGFEALMRWVRPDGTLLEPAAFIPAAERSGVISALGSWALREACIAASSCSPRNGVPAPYVAVNMSARQMANPRIVTEIKRLLGETGISSTRLVLELTEAVLIADPTSAARRLHALREIGVRIAIDDFGTGYSSLSYLRRLPMDILKIDRSFVAGLGVNDADTAIVAATIALADALQLDVVAEGVENETQAAELRRLGADHGQGYLFGRPASVDDPNRPAEPMVVPMEVAGRRPAPGDPRAQPRPVHGTATSVLVAYGDPTQRTATRLFLEHSGYAVGEASDGPSTLRQASSGSYDLVLLGLGLAGMDTAEMLTHLRRYSTLPAIVIGDRLPGADPALFLDLGADACVMHPSSLAEVEARVRVVLRRGSMAPPSNRIDLGDLIIDQSSHRVELRGTTLELRPREFALLSFMASAPDQTFSREELLEHVWPHANRKPAMLATVTEHVRRIRLKLESDATAPRRIITERGFGYRFATHAPEHSSTRT